MSKDISCCPEEDIALFMLWAIILEQEMYSDKILNGCDWRLIKHLEKIKL